MLFFNQLLLYKTHYIYFYCLLVSVIVQRYLAQLNAIRRLPFRLGYYLCLAYEDLWMTHEFRAFFYQNFLWKNSVFILLVQLWHMLSWSKWETGTLLAKTGNRRILSNSTSFTSRIAYHSLCKIFHDCHANQYGYR